MYYYQYVCTFQAVLHGTIKVQNSLIGKDKNVKTHALLKIEESQQKSKLNRRAREREKYKLLDIMKEQMSPRTIAQWKSPELKKTAVLQLTISQIVF